ncbi:MAG TPA: phage tail protein [Solibacillus sp.]
MVVTVDVDERRIREIQSQLGALQNKAPAIIARAMNRANTAIATSVNKGVRAKYYVKATDIKSATKKTDASPGNLSAKVDIKGSPIGLDKFKVSPKTVNPKRKSRLKIAVKKNGGNAVPGAFNANVNGIKVMKRTGRKRLPIERLYGPSIPQMAKNEEVANAARRRGGQVFEDRLKHEIRRLVGSGT